MSEIKNMAKTWMQNQTPLRWLWNDPFAPVHLSDEGWRQRMLEVEKQKQSEWEQYRVLAFQTNNNVFKSFFKTVFCPKSVLEKRKSKSECSLMTGLIRAAHPGFAGTVPMTAAVMRVATSSLLLLADAPQLSMATSSSFKYHYRYQLVTVFIAFVLSTMIVAHAHCGKFGKCVVT